MRPANEGRQHALGTCGRTRGAAQGPSGAAVSVVTGRGRLPRPHPHLLRGSMAPLTTAPPPLET